MKKIRCPKCDEFVVFDDSVLLNTDTVIFNCEHCGHSFKVRFNSNSKKEGESQNDDNTFYGSLLVLENVFTHKQIFPLHLGDNSIGRRNPGSQVNCPIITADPSMDRLHCIINVKQQKGSLRFSVRDCKSNVGTFVQNDILGDREQRLVSDGSIITLGATTLILKTVLDEEEL